MGGSSWSTLPDSNVAPADRSLALTMERKPLCHELYGWRVTERHAFRTNRSYGDVVGGNRQAGTRRALHGGVQDGGAGRRGWNRRVRDGGSRTTEAGLTGGISPSADLSARGPQGSSVARAVQRPRSCVTSSGSPNASPRIELVSVVAIGPAAPTRDGPSTSAWVKPGASSSRWCVT